MSQRIRRTSLRSSVATSDTIRQFVERTGGHTPIERILIANNGIAAGNWTFNLSLYQI
jgi:hypothetical protein